MELFLQAVGIVAIALVVLTIIVYVIEFILSVNKLKRSVNKLKRENNSIFDSLQCHREKLISLEDQVISLKILSKKGNKQSKHLK